MGARDPIPRSKANFKWLFGDDLRQGRLSAATTNPELDQSQHTSCHRVMKYCLLQWDAAFAMTMLARHEPCRVPRGIDRLRINCAAARNRRTVRTLKNKLCHKANLQKITV